jgi:exopolysaccharide biosynthesis polyprenyl glycosylphosphotransferase
LNGLILIDFLVVFSFNLLFFNWYLGLLFTASLTLSFFAFRLYDAESLQSYNEQLIRTVVGTTAGFIIVLIFYPLFENEINRYHFFGNFLFSVAGVPVLNVLVHRLFTKKLPVKRYLVLGRREEIEPVLKEVEEKSLGRYRFVEYINPSVETLKTKQKLYDAVLLADPRFEHILEKVRVENLEYLPNLVEKTLKRIPLVVMEKFREYYEVAFSSVKDDSPAKRILDVVVSLVALAVFSPIMLIVAIIIYLEDGLPVVFKQERVGKDGKIFTMIKFRSMRNEKKDSPKFVDQEKDRILKVGKFIRPFRLDEVLQFVNVLRGEMSVVGPRPEQVEFARIFEKQIPFYQLRHRVKPGITGWAQLMYKYSSSLDEVKKKLSYDLWYVKNRNIFLDLRIILQTLEAVLWRRGAK